MLDQTACDRGSWLLSAELALENGPPMSALSQHQPPATLEGEQPFSRLLDPRWAEIAMSHVRETEEYVQRRARLGKKDVNDHCRQCRFSASCESKSQSQVWGKPDANGCMNYEVGGIDGSWEPPVRVPGQDAPEIDVPRLLNSLPRLLLKCRGGVASFLQSILSKCPHLRSEDTPHSSVWPMPLPYPEVFRSGNSDLATWRRRRLCLQVTVLNWLALGRPSVAPRSIALGQRLHLRQWRVVRTLEFLVEDKNSVLKVDAQGMGRSAAKAESQHHEIGALHRALSSLQGNQRLYDSWHGKRACSNDKTGGVGSDFSFGRHVGFTKAPNNIVAKALVADRLKFGDAPRFDPTAYLDGHTAAMYSEPGNFHKDVFEKPPPVSIRATATEKIKLYQKLAACKRLAFLPCRDVEPEYSSGLFSVVKNMQKDRMIMDSRPPNVREIPAARWTACMASAAALTTFELREHEVLRCSGQDVSDFFSQFLVPAARLRRNVLHGKLSRQELETIFQRQDDAFRDGGFVGLNTMAMGDLRACEFAQGSHLSVLLEAKGFAPHELIMMHQPLPRGLLSIGVVIDDLVLLERVSKNLSATSGTLSDERMGPIKMAYERVGLPINESKEFRNSSCASFWGVEIDGDAGLMRSNSHRVWPLILITLRTCMLGLATIGLLESLSGSWISVLMLRRRLLSLMSEVFSATGCGLEQGAVIRLSDTLKDELLSLVVLAPLAVVNLRARPLGTIRATDSSDWGFAAVSGVISEEVAREAYRCSLSRSSWARLLPPFKAWQKARDLLPIHEELPDEKPYSTHPLWEILARGVTYKEEWRQQHDRQRHINITELAANLREEKRLSVNHSSAKVCYGLDSQVALGSLVKGRSSSAGLNRLLWKSIPTILGADLLYAGYGFFPSPINRADAPTRGQKVPAPDLELPHWWTAVEAGDFADYDAWLQQVEASAGVESSFPDFSDLGYHEPIKMKTGRGERSQQWRDRLKEDHHLARAEAVASHVTDGAESSPVELAPAAVAILESFTSEQVWWPRHSAKKFLKAGALDLFTGRGGVARSLLKMGCPFVVTFEWQRSSREDLLDEENRQKILQLIRLKAFKVVGSALICASFSRAVTPAVRTHRFPRGVPWMSATMKIKVSAGNSHCDYATLVIQACEDGGVFYWLENPDSSWLWQQKSMRRFLPPDSAFTLRVDYCRFGTPWRKRTRVALNLPSLCGLRFLCTCTQRHVALRGMHPSLKKPWTAVAEPCPRAFVKLLASGIANDVSWHSTKLNIAGCAKVGSLRVGESKNPGPRRSRAPRGFSLEFAPVQFASSILIGEKCWQKFMSWVRESITTVDPLALFLRVPLFMAHTIRRYGDDQFSTGGSLMYYRHLVIVCQRKVPSLKQYIHVCWELATRWEAIEPVVHRVPAPKAVVHAMVALAWGFKWFRWAAVTMICFAGIARIGEVLRCRRRDLLLPRDILEEDVGAAFVLLARSKTSYRSKAVVQHLKIDDKYVISILDKVFSGYGKDTPLYHGSPSVYRNRWDKLIRLLGCEGLSLTPGGLRGGGSVAAYREGKALQEIMWRMRVRSQQTLESYLQEVSALSVLSAVDDAALLRIRSCSSIYWHLVHADGV